MMIGKAICLASNLNPDLLRSQLDQLHSEADFTRRKANNARFRLMRLSEAAENIYRQAAVSVQVGKENEARDLLLKKKKIVQALEKSKGRVELLDELAAKLTEAISIKEAQLVSHVASDLAFDGDEDDAGSPVRIVSTTKDPREILDNDINIALKNTDVGEDQNSISDINNKTMMPCYKEDKDINDSDIISAGIKASISSNFKGSSYSEFLGYLDQQLSKIEKDLVTVLENSTLDLENEETKISRMQQMLEILENIRGARVRIQDFTQKNGAA